MEFDIVGIIERMSKKTKKYWLILLIIAIAATIFIWYFLPTISYNIPKIKKTDLILKIIYTAIIWGICLFQIFCKYIFRKNRTKLPGVGFLIQTSMLNKETFEKEMFFKRFYEDTKGKFKIIVYDDLNVSSDEKTLKLLEKYNLNILFIIDEVSAKKNGEDFYKFSIKKVNISFDSDIINIESYASKITYDITHAMTQYIEVYKNNNYTDSERESNSLTAQISYIMSILYVISPTPEKAFELLDGLSYLISNTQKKNLRYIEKNIPYRYFEAYNNTISNIINYQEYYNDGLILNRLKELTKNAEEYITKEYKKSKIKKDDYIESMDVLLHYRAMVEYEENKIDKAIETIKQISPKPYNILTRQLNLAFLYGFKKEYKLSYEYYNKVSKRDDLTEYSSIDVLNEIRNFINIRLDKDPENEGLKFCSALTNIYFADKELGEKYLKALSINNKEIEVIYNEIYAIPKVT